MDMAPGILAHVIALALTVVVSVVLAVFVALRARPLPGAMLLAAFLAGVAVWSAAQAAPALWGAAAAPFTVAVMALSPLPAAAFLHLAFAYALSPLTRPVAIAAHGLAGVAAVAGLVLGVGRVVPWGGFAGFFVPSPTGWVVLGFTAALSLGGHLRLLLLWVGSRGAQRDQARWVFASSAIGLVALTGFAFPAFGIDVHPWPVSILPVYSLVLVHGIVRHRFMVADAWAQRGLVWVLSLTVVGGVSALSATLPLAFAGRPAGLLGDWILPAAMILVGLALSRPLEGVVDRLVFPGGRVSEADIGRWRDQLASALDEAELARLANRLLRDRLALPADGPGLVVTGETVDLVGWEAAPAGARRLAERFAALVGEAARRLAAARRLVEAEREARLAEIGALAATVAHDLRNPLGIVTMAATEAPAEVRAEIAEQVARMNHLITDILDYARAWTVVPRTIAVADLAARFGVEARVPPALTIAADPVALDRVMANLVDNARALASRVALVAEAGPPGTLDICDDGPGIAPEIAEDLFRPFVSRRPGGTGLGLAIVRRIMEAHGGSVSLVERPGWTTCFRLTFGARR